MAETSPAGVRGTERLHEYWVHGEGAAKIRWGEGGDYDRCVTHLGKYLDDPHGYCADAHKAATGMWPAQHAKELKGRSGMTTDAIEHAGPENAELAKAAGRAESLGTFCRSFPLSDLSVRSSREGKIVTAYAAAFNAPAEIHDQDGDYIEELDPVCFNKAISDARPQGGRSGWRMGVFYNHGMTIMGTPSDRHSMPVGVPIEVKADSHGVLTETRYHRSEFAEEIVEGLESGAIPGYSFSGTFRRSSPFIPRGGFRKDRAGGLQTVRRMESTLREYGPTPFPAYKEAAIVGMRAEALFGAMAADPEFAMRMLAMFRDGTPAEPLPLSGTPLDEEPPPRSRLVHSGRSIKQVMNAERAAFLLRHRGA